jgi:hypothetical protein
VDECRCRIIPKGTGFGVLLKRFMPAVFIERRLYPRSGLSLVDSALPPEYCNSVNVSHTGVYFKTSSGHYLLGMEVYVTRDFVVAGPNRAEIMGAIVRIDKLEDNGFGVGNSLPAGHLKKVSARANVPSV